jgi:hypothetical protein
MKKFMLPFLITLSLTLGLANSTSSSAGDFVWGYQLVFEPCSSWLAIYQTICLPSSGGFCQASAQNPCPGPPYLTGT